MYAYLVMRRMAIALLVALAGCVRPPDAESHSIPHPDRNGAGIEYFEERPAGTGPWPTVILLHGYQNPTGSIGGRAFANWGVLRKLAGDGYLAVAISLPGYGGSSGPPDFAGPFTQHAVAAVIAKLRRDRAATPDKILIEGISLGAVTAAMVATRDDQLAGLILISGLYDIPAFFAHPKTIAANVVKAAATAQTDATPGALQARSALPLAGRIRASTLILNGAKDDRTDPDQALQLAAGIRASGGHAIVRIYPDFGHEIPVKARDAEVEAFIDATLRR